MPFVPDTTSPRSYFAEEAFFRGLYPLPMQQLDALHWSPLQVVYQAVQFLAREESVKILDIGSGIGKFCLAAAYYQPAAFFEGVEQRKDLVEQAELAQEALGLRNAHFIHGNFTQLDLKQYNHFYFYNSFFENLSGTDRIDDRIDYSRELYTYYSHYLYMQLEEMPIGTRIATYCSWGDELPPCYVLAETHVDSLLKCWIKEDSGLVNH
jgi:SAM-dependent methyltransferase